MKRIVNAFGKRNRASRACGVSVLWTMTAIALHAQTFTTLFSFPDAEGPFAGLVQAADGNLYGSTLGGGGAADRFGVSGAVVPDWGTIFRITPGGAATRLYNFCVQTDPDCTDEKRRDEFVQPYFARPNRIKCWPSSRPESPRAF